MIVARRGSLVDAMRYVGLPLLALFAWDVLIALLYVELGQKWVALNDLPTSLLGSALALLVTLRNNSAYARWLEARQLWGGIAHGSRTLARQVRLYLPDDATGRSLVKLQVAYAQALRCHLRRQEPWDQIAHLVTPALRRRLDGSANLPDALLAEIAGQLATLRRDGLLDSVQLAAFDGTLASLSAMQGGTERIKSTPLPGQYSVFLRVFVRMFCILLPLAMVTDLGLATPLGSTLAGFMFLALEQVGTNLENPFDNSVHDVPLTAITRTIEINLREGLGESSLPKPLEPVAGVLW